MTMNSGNAIGGGGTSSASSSANVNNSIQPNHGVNVLLGGAMMSGIILVIFIMCYCCHKNARKQDGPVPITYWRDTGLPLHVYTVEGHRHRECCESEDLMLVDLRRPSTPPPILPPPLGPPPSYEVAVGSVETPTTMTTTSDYSGIGGTTMATGGTHILGNIENNNNYTKRHQWPSSMVNNRRHSDVNGLPSYERAIQMQSIGHV